jgi:hypothetical protein
MIDTNCELRFEIYDGETNKNLCPDTDRGAKTRDPKSEEHMFSFTGSRRVEYKVDTNSKQNQTPVYSKLVLLLLSLLIFL